MTTGGTTYRGRVVASLHTILASKVGRWLQAGGRSTQLAPLRLFLTATLSGVGVSSLHPRHRTMPETLEQAGLPLGIVSTGTARKRHTVGLLGPERQMACIVISGELGRRKPDRGIFGRLITCLGVPADAILFVGDRPRQDIGGARDAGRSLLGRRRAAREPGHRLSPRVAWRR